MAAGVIETATGTTGGMGAGTAGGRTSGDTSDGCGADGRHERRKGPTRRPKYPRTRRASWPSPSETRSDAACNPVRRSDIHRRNKRSGGNHRSRSREGYCTHHRQRGSHHGTSTCRQRQLTQGNWHRGQKAHERSGRGLNLPLALLLPLQQKFMHIITHPRAAIIIPVVALTMIVDLAGLTLARNTQTMRVVLLRGQKT